MLWKSALLVFASVLLPIYKDTARYAQKTPAKPTTGSNVTLFLCGDVMSGRGIDQVLPHSVNPVLYESYVRDAREYVTIAERKNGPIPKPVNYRYIWGDALQILEEIKPALRIINLETSITTNAEPWPEKGINYRMHPANIDVLTAAAIDVCVLANNHVLDWNHKGLLETINTLQAADIAYAGAGHSPMQAQKPAVLPVKDGRVILFAYGSGSGGVNENWRATDKLPGVNVLPDFSDRTIAMVKEQVQTIKMPNDIVVFSVHWGDNWGYEVPEAQRHFAHQLIAEAGVDVVYGHSSHHAKGIEVYQNKLILYGTGDFINDYEGIRGHEAYRDDLSIMYFPELDQRTGKLIRLKMVPLHIRKFRLNKITAADAKWLAGVLAREGRKFGTTIELQPDNSFLLRW